MRNLHKMVCLRCGGKETGQGKQSAYASVAPYKKICFGSNLIHIICID